MIYILVLLCMLYMCLQVEFCAREAIWKVNNIRKPMIFYDVLYHLNVIFLQRVFEGLKSVDSNSKTTRQRCTKGTLFFYSSNKIDRREFSNGVNHSSNKDFMRKLQHKQWRVHFQTHLTSKSHNFLLWNQIEAQEKSMEIY
jgi:hypothetical protein